MASIHKEFVVHAPAQQVWDAVRDVGEVHRRLVPGVLTDAKLDGDARVVTFANGMVVRELIVDLDDAKRRLVYTAVGGRATHHNASIQVLAVEPQRCTVVWITDVLPESVAPGITSLVDLGAEDMKRTLEARQ